MVTVTLRLCSFISSTLLHYNDTNLTEAYLASVVRSQENQLLNIFASSLSESRTPSTTSQKKALPREEHSL